MATLLAVRPLEKALPVPALAGARFDVVVAGGGPAGATAAAVCATHGLSVLLVERSGYDAPRIGETLPPGARDLLARNGVWDRFVQAGHRPAYALRSAWGGADLVAQDYLFHPHGRGWQVDRRRFDAMLAEAAEEAGARRVRAIVRGCRRSGAGWLVDLDGRELCAAFVIDATGRSARIARALGARRTASDALIGAIAGAASDDDGGAMIEAIAEGWWYSARVPDGDLIIAFMTDADLWASLRGSWSELLARAPHTRARIASAAPTEPERVFAAASSCLAPIAGPGWIAVGDAAMTLDPLSGQGICRAIATGEHAARAIVAARGGEPGVLASLAETARARYDAYLAMRARFYAMEQRFAGAPFWTRRHGVPQGGSGRPEVPVPSPRTARERSDDERDGVRDAPEARARSLCAQDEHPVITCELQADTDLDRIDTALARTRTATAEALRRRRSDARRLHVGR